MKRRHLLALTAVASLPSPGRAQSMPRVGVLIAGDPEPTWSLFKKAMTDFGYVDGRTVTYEYRAAAASSGKLDGFAQEMVALKVNVIVPVLSPAVAAAQRATKDIPIVFNGGAPVIGAVENMARPEGNLTGAYSPGSTLAGKTLQLFHEVKPDTRRFGLLLNSADPFHVPLQRDVSTVAKAEKIELTQVLVKSRDELPAAFDQSVSNGAAGVLVQPSLGLDVCAALALERRVAAISFRREFVEQGGLMAYSADQAAINRAVAAKVDKVLKGVSIRDIPIDQASRYELVVNQKTANALGFVFPPLFLARVDQVIE